MFCYLLRIIVVGFLVIIPIFSLSAQDLDGDPLTNAVRRLNYSVLERHVPFDLEGHTIEKDGRIVKYIPFGAMLRKPLSRIYASFTKYSPSVFLRRDWRERPVKILKHEVTLSGEGYLVFNSSLSKAQRAGVRKFFTEQCYYRSQWTGKFKLVDGSILIYTNEGMILDKRNVEKTIRYENGYYSKLIPRNAKVEKENDEFLKKRLRYLTSPSPFEVMDELILHGILSLTEEGMEDYQIIKSWDDSNKSKVFDNKKVMDKLILHGILSLTKEGMEDWDNPDKSKVFENEKAKVFEPNHLFFDSIKKCLVKERGNLDSDRYAKCLWIQHTSKGFNFLTDSDSDRVLQDPDRPSIERVTEKHTCVRIEDEGELYMLHPQISNKSFISLLLRNNYITHSPKFEFENECKCKLSDKKCACEYSCTYSGLEYHSNFTWKIIGKNEIVDAKENKISESEIKAKPKAKLKAKPRVMNGGQLVPCAD